MSGKRELETVTGTFWRPTCTPPVATLTAGHLVRLWMSALLRDGRCQRGAGDNVNDSPDAGNLAIDGARRPTISTAIAGDNIISASRRRRPGHVPGASGTKRGRNEDEPLTVALNGTNFWTTFWSRRQLG